MPATRLGTGRKKTGKAKKPKRPCECGDPGCPVHKGRSSCSKASAVSVRRIDMDHGTTSFRMCRGCASDALDSGVFG